MRDEAHRAVLASGPRPAAPSARLRHAALLRGARHRGDRSDARPVTELGQDASAPWHGDARGKLGRRQVTVEDRLVAAFDAVKADVVEHPDLFARVTRSLADARARRRWRQRAALGTIAFALGLVAIAAPFIDLDNGRITMDWWVIELLTNIVLVAIAILLGPVHQTLRAVVRGGRLPGQPAHGQELPRADGHRLLPHLHGVHPVHHHVRATPGLAGIAWPTSGSTRWSRIGGILLLMGLLHAANVVALPVIGRLLSLNRRLDEDPVPRPGPLEVPARRLPATRTRHVDRARRTGRPGPRPAVVTRMRRAE